MMFSRWRKWQVVICCTLISGAFPLPLIFSSYTYTEIHKTSNTSSVIRFPRTPIYLTPPFSTNFPAPVNDTVRIINGSLLIDGKDIFKFGNSNISFPISHPFFLKIHLRQHEFEIFHGRCGDNYLIPDSDFRF